VLMIQIAAAVLLVLGSGLIFRALLEIDAPTRPQAIVRRHMRPARPEPDIHLPKAA
jgi:hypothetical protein